MGSNLTESARVSQHKEPHEALEPVPPRTAKFQPQSPLFARLNQDIRNLIYEHIVTHTHVLDESWSGFVLSCSLAHLEVEEAMHHRFAVWMQKYAKDTAPLYSNAKDRPPPKAYQELRRPPQLEYQFRYVQSSSRLSSTLQPRLRELTLWLPWPWSDMAYIVALTFVESVRVHILKIRIAHSRWTFGDWHQKLMHYLRTRAQKMEKKTVRAVETKRLKNLTIYWIFSGPGYFWVEKNTWQNLLETF
jgi:hypothetical protein